MLFVSSDSKIALLGSTVAVLRIGPGVGGATTLNVIVRVRPAGIVPPLHVTTWVIVSASQRKPPLVL